MIRRVKQSTLDIIHAYLEENWSDFVVHCEDGFLSEQDCEELLKSLKSIEDEDEDD